MVEKLITEVAAAVASATLIATIKTGTIIAAQNL